MTGRASEMRRHFVSVGTKLAVAINLVLLVVTAAVYVGLTRHEREKLLAAKELAARMTGGLFVRSATTPVIFDDQTGIRDAVALLAEDPEVLGVEVWRATPDRRADERLAAHLRDQFGRGVPARFVDAPALERLADRIVLRDAVRDQDGKVIAVAAVQYSLARENAAFAELRRRILVAAGGTAALVGLLLAGVSRRWIIGPLERLLGAVRQVEAGERVALGGAANDEVGRLADAFARMADAVARRERDIAHRNQDLKRVLDTVGQGFLVLDADGRVAPERSAIVDRWFGPLAEGQTLPSYLHATSPATAEMIDLGLASIREGYMPIDVCVDQLPRRMDHGDRHYGFEYHAVLDGEQLATLVLVISDVTAEVEKERAEEIQRDVVAGVSRMMADKSGFADFMAEADGLVTRIVDGAGDATIKQSMRDIHTLKGICAVFGLGGVARFCHALEERTLEAGAPPSLEDRGRLGDLWHSLHARLALFTGAEDYAVKLGDVEYRAFLDLVRQRAPHAELRSVVESWTDDPVLPRLERLAEHARALACRLGRCPVDATVEGSPLRLPHQPWSRLWPVLVHVVRNAVDHGLETAEERAAAGKPAAALLRLSVAERAGGLVIAIADDGRGVDWDGVGRHAAALGLAAATHEDLVAALFADGVTTRESATATSGRGVGLAAVWHVVSALGGTIAVESDLGSGCRVVIHFPVSAQARGAVRRTG